MVGRNITYFPISLPRQDKVRDIKTIKSVLSV